MHIVATPGILVLQGFMVVHVGPKSVIGAFSGIGREVFALDTPKIRHQHASEILRQFYLYISRIHSFPGHDIFVFKFRHSPITQYIGVIYNRT